ncbi:MAG: DUF350 domain-containing protein [Kordiimonadaceae bacterium]|nr:DUF350 domain-containing protein [Nitrospina sp.]MBT7544853.1 DUF350 domain-containing protein [Kordiimonadaceae bacterium]
MIMNLDNLLSSLTYLGSCFAILAVGHWIFILFRRTYDIQSELLDKGNTSLALVICGYYLGLTFSIGGIIAGPSAGLENDLIDMLVYGPLAIVLLNLSALINDRFILNEFNIKKEILQDQNCGTGVVEFAIFIATGLNIFGALYGLGGSIVTAIVFWFVGQIILILASKYYNLITRYNIHEQIEKDNVAVGIGFAGALISIGNLLRAASAENFVSWQDNLTTFIIFMGIGVVLLPVIRALTDRILLPGRSLSDELVNQVKPNQGAAFLEASSYIGTSFLITWCI